MDNSLKLEKNIIIYLHMPFDLSNGGVTVQYYLAHILDSMGNNIRICNIYDNNKTNSIFNKFITVNEFIKNNNNQNSIVIYCEGIIGNPLNAKYVVRWMLSKLGQNVPIHYCMTWDPNEIIYFFNTDCDLINNNIPYKQLTILYVNPHFKNLERQREESCFAKRKPIIKNIDTLHDINSFEITRKHTQENYLEIFNNHKKFICYDPLSFLSIISPLCGCISIIHPITNVSKKEYFKMTAFYNYLNTHNCNSIYGIAYGNSQDEIDYAINTLPLIKDQIEDIQKWFINEHIYSFINDLNNFDNNTNTLLNYIISSNISTDFINKHSIQKYNTINAPILHNTIDRIEIDYNFYRKFYKDLHNMSNYELYQHYIKYGKNEGRYINKKQYENRI